MKTIKIFLASSNELSEDRDQIGLFINRENEKLIKKEIRFELIIWEKLSHSFRGNRKQDDYNNEMLKCDIVLALFFKKVGQFTKEEFELAYQNLKEGKKPQHLYVYFKSGNISTEEITRDYMKIIELKEYIKEHEQYPGSYDSIDNLKNQLKEQFDLIIPDIQSSIIPASKPDNTPDISNTIPLIPDVYKDWIIDHCQYMDVDRLREKGNVIQVRLPEIFIPLYTYPPKEKVPGKNKPNVKTAEAILSFYFDETENGLDIDTVMSFCKAEKAIFLLDGLDEINTESRDIIMKSFADFKSKHKKNKFVLSGRPHGMEGAVVDRFGDRHVKIQTLNMEQVQEFIPVAGGEYKLGQDVFAIKPFEIGKFPVTNSWFEEFINAGGYDKEEYWSKEGLKWLAYTEAKLPSLWNERKWKCPNSPVVGISWYEACAFTKWLSAVDTEGYEYRLLKENEWEAAASGIEGREYPWGNEWDKNKCNSGEIEINKTSPVGVFKGGNTPENISDLSGNVWEWTTSDYHSKNSSNDFVFEEDMQKLVEEEKYVEYFSKLDKKNRELPVLRGGSWHRNSVICRCAYRYFDAPLIRYYIIGFRCARTLTL